MSVGVSGLRVAVVGGGLGGLCLAQGLRRSGVAVTVYEADTGLGARRQGYRLHLDARARLAMKRCLPPELFELFVATCGQPSRRFSAVSEQLQVLQETPVDPGGDPFAAQSMSTSVNRQTLREVLAAGLDNRLVYGAELAGFDVDEAGVRLRFADGRQADADVLVGADGVNSVVRRQYLPHAEVVDTGSRIIYGKTPLSDTVETLLPPSVRDGFTAVVGGQIGMATGLVRFRQRPEQAAAALAPGVALSPAGDYLMWAVSANRKGFRLADAELSELNPEGLHGVATSMIASWHLDLRSLVDLAAVEETFLVRVRTSTPTPEWPPSRVTLLGDAVHAMSPARGSGANTALKDAGLLCSTLAAAPLDQNGLVAAVGSYEMAMRDYGHTAVEASRRAEKRMGARRHSLAVWMDRRLASRRSNAS